MTTDEIEQFKTLLAFLIKIEQGPLIDHSPDAIWTEIDLVSGDEQNYLATLSEEQRKRFDAYVEFHKLS